MKDYKKILEGVVNIINTAEKSDIGFTNICTYISEKCPELKESEDEKIRKELMDFIYVTCFPVKDLKKKERFLDWLDAQNKKKTDPRYKYLEDLIAADDIHQMSMNDEMVKEAKDKAIAALSKIGVCELLGFEKQCEQNDSCWSKDDQKMLEHIISDLQEFMSCETDKELISDYKKEIAWLEKQDGKNKVKSEIVKDYIGEENVWNDARYFRPKHLQRYQCYDKYMGGVYCYVYDDISKYWCTQTTEEHDPDGDNHISDYSDYRVTAWRELPTTPFYPSKDSIEKQGKSALEAIKEEQVDNANKVEPKFKVCDCVISNDGTHTYLVKERKRGTYVMLDIGDDEEFNIIIETADRTGRLWTIEDAKDGDVLISQSGNPLIYNGNYNSLDIGAYCGITCDGKFKVGVEKCNWTENIDIKPSTKEQRDLLFAKMKEMGYEWDGEKKELKKIKSKTLDSDKVIKWLEDMLQASVGARVFPRQRLIDKFKKDFGL